MIEVEVELKLNFFGRGDTLAMSNKLNVPLDSPTHSKLVERWSSAHLTLNPTPLLLP
jgi:hypothetical protein